MDPEKLLAIKKTFYKAILTDITRGRPCAMGKKFPNAKGY